MPVISEELRGDVYAITFNRPERKNPMSTELYHALYQALGNAEAAKSSIVVIRGAGKNFSAGGDITEMKSGEDMAAKMYEGAELLHQNILYIRRINAIVVAVVEGAAAGAGVCLSLACDVSVAEKKAVMNLAYRRIGLTPDGGGSILLPRIVGAKRANEMYLFSRNIYMDEAEQLGMVNFVWEEQEMEEKLRGMIEQLKALPLETIGYYKDLTNKSVFSGLEAHLNEERDYLAKLGAGPLFRQRLDAFFARR